MGSSTPIVCLLSDFGLADHFIGTMKGILLSADPDVQIVDISHDVPPQDVRFGAFQLMETYGFFPEKSIFLAVVDPGVGSNRKIICAEAANRVFVGPDNGLLSWVFKNDRPTFVMELIPDMISSYPISATFHGRDIMAPFVAKLLKGEAINTLGRSISQWETIPFPPVLKAGSRWVAEVLLVDHFGNLVTNLKASELKDFSENSKIWFEIADKNTIRGVSQTYSSVEEGKPLIVVGSSGFLEIALRNGHAANFFQLKAGHKFHVHFRT
ncbi:MAG: S-adenosyl-l-methionine hydroxide adenosyltransferase family protein [Elusimicrobiota bacterium]